MGSNPTPRTRVTPTVCLEDFEKYLRSKRTRRGNLLVETTIQTKLRAIKTLGKRVNLWDSEGVTIFGGCRLISGNWGDHGLGDPGIPIYFTMDEWNKLEYEWEIGSSTYTLRHAVSHGWGQIRPSTPGRGSVRVMTSRAS